MEADKITISDLSIFNSDEELSVFNKLNFTTTSRGKDQLRKNFNSPLDTIEKVTDIQRSIKVILGNTEGWPHTITNGTVMVVESFF